VYVRATLCGSPFERHTDIHAFQKAFVPLNKQIVAAMKIAKDWHHNMAGIMGTEAVNVPSWAANLADASSSIESFLDSPPPGLGEPLEYDHPAFNELTF